LPGCAVKKFLNRLGANQRDAEVYRLERRCIAAPAAAIGLLERERFLDP
jgi:hypothetical protein